MFRYIYDIQLASLDWFEVDGFLDLECELKNGNKGMSVAGGEKKQRTNYTVSSETLHRYAP